MTKLGFGIGNVLLGVLNLGILAEMRHKIIAWWAIWGVKRSLHFMLVIFFGVG